MNRFVTLKDGTRVAAIGQGTWYLGENRYTRNAEIDALRTGIDLGLTLIDSAEMYGDGKAEKLVGDAIKGYDRKKLFLISKVYPFNAGRKNIFSSCKNSIERMNADYLDLYLLHWRGGIALSETVECMERLVEEGLIKRWGVSNFDVDDMDELLSLPNGHDCAVDQVLYNVASRGIEYELMPLLSNDGIPVISYCPLAQAGMLSDGLMSNPVLLRIAEKHSVSVAVILLSFAIRNGKTIAIPRSSKSEHVRDNRRALDVELDQEDLLLINKEFPAPRRKFPLDIV